MRRSTQRSTSIFWTVYQAFMVLVVWAAVSLLIATIAEAQDVQCDVSGRIYDRLSDRLGERRQAVGISGGSLIEVWANPFGTFTILTSADGISCIMMVGEHFYLVNPVTADGDPD
ncbi:hypothetical protein FGK63_01845 [Ruegeria sediminis]|uniref:Transmembrane protein n=1 Tax=Ruegeria sediminis TaxID=2583820 RepID=A0ABY2X4V4_9RHOB|nr:hypothetical protein [Ruegeria sediminis]TMV09837.1 hypothetical protein FGK63_01845 [Ruegeria sediminis]